MAGHNVLRPPSRHASSGTCFFLSLLTMVALYRAYQVPVTRKITHPFFGRKFWSWFFSTTKRGRVQNTPSDASVHGKSTTILPKVTIFRCVRALLVFRRKSARNSFTPGGVSSWVMTTVYLTQQQTLWNSVSYRLARYVFYYHRMGYVDELRVHSKTTRWRPNWFGSSPQLQWLRKTPSVRNVAQIIGQVIDSHCMI